MQNIIDSWRQDIKSIETEHKLDPTNATIVTDRMLLLQTQVTSFVKQNNSTLTIFLSIEFWWKRMNSF